MTLNELVDQLDELSEEHGDNPVFILGKNGALEIAAVYQVQVFYNQKTYLAISVSSETELEHESWQGIDTTEH